MVSAHKRPVWSERVELADATLLVVDDDAFARRSVVRVLESCGARVETAASADQGAKLIAEGGPFDAAVVDYFLVDDQLGLDLIAQLRSGSRPCCALMITADSAWERGREAIAAGADDFLLKPFEVDELIVSVARMIERTRRWRSRLGTTPKAPPRTVEGVIRDPAAVGVARLTVFLDELCRRGDLSFRERQVLEQVLKGKKNRAAGEAIGVTERTVKYHMAHILKKVGVTSRSELFNLVFAPPRPRE